MTILSILLRKKASWNSTYLHEEDEYHCTPLCLYRERLNTTIECLFPIDCLLHLKKSVILLYQSFRLEEAFFSPSPHSVNILCRLTLSTLFFTNVFIFRLKILLLQRQYLIIFNYTLKSLSFLCTLKMYILIRIIYMKEHFQY